MGNKYTLHVENVERNYKYLENILSNLSKNVQNFGAMCENRKFKNQLWEIYGQFYF